MRQVNDKLFRLNFIGPTRVFIDTKSNKIPRINEKEIDYKIERRTKWKQYKNRNTYVTFKP